MKSFIYSFVVVLISFMYSFATLINVPTDVDSIQGGINLATDSDTVLVQPGTYVENINFNGKNIVVGSLTLTTGDTSYISQTVIDGDSSGSVVNFENGEDSTAVLCGFTITNGFSIVGGGGIRISNSSPVVYNLIVKNNSIDRDCGAGIFCNNSSPILDNIVICGNEGTPSSWPHISIGGGICLSNNSNPILTNVEIGQNNSNIGGGIFIDNSNPTILNSLISNNRASYGGGGIYCVSSSLILNNVIIKENSALPWIDAYGGGILFTNSNAEFSKVLIKGNIGRKGGGFTVVLAV